MTSLWGWVASPGAALTAGVCTIILLTLNGYHRNDDNSLANTKIVKVFLLSTLAYTFLTLAISEILIEANTLPVLISDGFGNGRVAYLLVGVALDQMLRVWDEFRV